MQIVELRTQNLSDPIGIQTERPVLSWKLKASENGQRQTAYRIVAAATEEKLESGEYDIWDSGRVRSGRNYAIAYEGRRLRSMERVYWKVLVWDKDGNMTSFSPVAHWEMGLLSEDDWQGKWITRGNEFFQSESASAAAPVFSKEFSVQQGKRVASCRLYISGLGLFEAYVNGVMAGKDSYFNPGESDVRETVYYCTYDITDLLNADEVRGWKNAVSFLLGNGQYSNYRIHRQPGRYYKTDDFRSEDEVKGMFGTVKGIAQIVITYDDGSQTTIGTDESWSCMGSPITENSWYGGEDYDASREVERWNDINPAVPRNKWRKAILVERDDIPKGKLRGRESEPILIQEADTIPPDKIMVKRISESHGGVTYLVDMGRNGAGFPEITLKNTKAGWRIRMYPAEVNTLDGFHGHINQASCTQSASNEGDLIYDTYTTKGVAEESWHPRFCYHGYRYLEVSAPSGLELANENFRGYILRTDNKKNGFFSCSDQSLCQINILTERSIESNMYSTFTDCPQIEKLGWLETPGLMFYSMSHTYDISSWIPKLIQDMEDAQYGDGSIAAIAPEYFRIAPLSEDLNWNGSIIFTAWQYYEAYGSKEVFANGHYDTMKKYMDYLENHVAENNLILTGQMGEWGEMATYGTTPVVLVETTAYYRLAVTMGKIAKALGKSADEEHYVLLAEKIREAFHGNIVCCNKEHLYGNGTQSGYGCVLYSGIVSDENCGETVERLVRSIEEADYHLTSGEVGLKQVFSALAENGRSDIVYRMVTNKTMPGYQYFVEKGLTTLPEYWNFEDLWNGLGRSLNHAMMGHVKEWFTRYLAGIQPDGTGYDAVVIRPAVIDGLDEVNGSIDTVHGNIVSHWMRDRNKNSFTIEITLPVGVTASVFVPAFSGKKTLLCNGAETSVFDAGVGYMRMQNELEPGFYKLEL